MIQKEKITKTMEDTYKNSTKMSEMMASRKIMETLGCETALNFIQLRGEEVKKLDNRQGLNVVMLYESYEESKFYECVDKN